MFVAVRLRAPRWRRPRAPTARSVGRSIVRRAMSALPRVPSIGPRKPPRCARGAPRIQATGASPKVRLERGTSISRKRPRPRNARPVIAFCRATASTRGSTAGEQTVANAIPPCGASSIRRIRRSAMRASSVRGHGGRRIQSAGERCAESPQLDGRQRPSSWRGRSRTAYVHAAAPRSKEESPAGNAVLTGITITPRSRREASYAMDATSAWAVFATLQIALCKRLSTSSPTARRSRRQLSSAFARCSATAR